MAYLSNTDLTRNDPIFGSPFVSKAANKKTFPNDEQNAYDVYQVVHDELYLDGNARQNLATFCQTFEEEELHALMDLSIDKNMIDKDEYPQTAAIENYCVHMIADLWNAPDSATTIGTSTVGSSEACMLGGLAALWRWRAKRKAAGKPIDKPNMVCGPVQVCWLKFARYWDIEIREMPMRDNHYVMAPEDMLSMVDENTIVVVPTLGQTYTGLYEPVKPLADALDKLQTEKGLDIDIHVDGASGGFLAPFCAPEMVWDFRLPRVKSISTSGHKFGLAPLGVGWVVWRENERPAGRPDLPRELSGWRSADLRTELLPSCRTGHLPVLQPAASGQGRLSAHSWRLLQDGTNAGGRPANDRTIRNDPQRQGTGRHPCPDLEDQGWRENQLQPVRSGGPPENPRLARPGLLAATSCRQHHCPAHSGQTGSVCRYGFPASRRLQTLHRLLRQPSATRLYRQGSPDGQP